MEKDIEKNFDLILLKVTFIVQNIIKNILTEGDRVQLTNSLKKEIEADIERCNKHIDRNGSMALYDELVAKYVVIDPEFEKGLSITGKVGSLGGESDYRPELKAIANKLHMWIVLDDNQEETQNHIKGKLQKLLERGKQIGSEEFHAATGGFPYSYVGGPKYDVWMADINILNERHLKTHPAYESIHTSYDQRADNPAAYENMMAQLQGVIDDDEFWESLNDNTSDGKEKEKMSTSNKVFIVHGHDEAAKQSVARFLEKCGFEAVILNEQADGGRTIIEKIQHYTDVAFAIVLYTPCDIGRAKEEKRGKSRARQNVVFEHGYLIGRLGRDKVCALVKDGVETPGDFSGVVYKPMDAAGAWKTEILKEMKNVGIAVDASKLL